MAATALSFIILKINSEKNEFHYRDFCLHSTFRILKKLSYFPDPAILLFFSTVNSISSVISLLSAGNETESGVSPRHPPKTLSEASSRAFDYIVTTLIVRTVPFRKWRNVCTLHCHDYFNYIKLINLGGKNQLNYFFSLQTQFFFKFPSVNCMN